MREDETEIQGDGPVDGTPLGSAGSADQQASQQRPAGAASAAASSPDGLSTDEPAPGPDRSLVPPTSVPAPEMQPARREGEWEAWADALRRVGGRSPLTDFIDTTATRIELSATHPGDR